ncbi:TetR family transcriptional regulator [Cellulomonas alba]|uniref:TetR family transcriptional regulator n=1 Tax=Cellulomonas alba TaxID=3053467 RepID=A0ABT7SFJ3_9CELL|nr:TetR family transcriptional regulator [Cellulomonas alba]MDM7854896.1 TetR family transcriptional regulator [Cellulomonas alba]
MKTRDKLLAAAADALAAEGVSAISGRSIAARAGVNQALVFYHFESVADLLAAAVRWSVDESVADYRRRLADVSTLSELLALGDTLQAVERDRGNVAQMAQVMAGAQQEPRLAEAARYAIDAWAAEVEAVIARVLETSPLGGLLDAAGAARAVTAAFIGLQLYEGVDPAGARSATDALRVLGVVAETVDGLGPVATRALRARVRRKVTRAGRA